MCLIVKSKKYKIAKKDITCYKVLRQPDFWEEGAKFQSIFQKFEWEFDKIYDTGVELKQHYYSYDPKKNIVDENAFHTFDSFDEAYRFYSFFNDNRTNIVKCIIPKGSKYYSDVFTYACAFSYRSYASNQLKLVEVI